MSTGQNSFRQLLEDLQRLEIPDDLKKRLQRELCSLLYLFLNKAMSDMALAKMKPLRKFGAINKYAPVLSHEAERQPDYDESVTLANTLTCLTKKYGRNTDVQNFMAYLKTLLERQQLGTKLERYETLVQFCGEETKKQILKRLVTWLIQESVMQEIPPTKIQETPACLLNYSVRGKYVERKLPGYEQLQQSIRLRPAHGYYQFSVQKTLYSERKCDPNILRDDLSIFVLSRSRRRKKTVNMDEFYFLLQNGRIDFLRYLLQNQMLPISNDGLRVLCATPCDTILMQTQLEILKALDNDIEPGGNAKFRDPFGNDLIWYTLSSSTIPAQETTGRWTQTTLVQDYLFKIIGTAHKQFYGCSLEEVFLK